ncbi:MAG: hypothetical protein AVDCRST_MAG64-2610 [uncultured Phycisphaerae bacterium]|uniref:Uncharacterized protein n=1 Tax=uncultured Phycisphaerae bacterium TaxID=904963 RepID=A0A6J4PNY3_9BACT|nr:MAG: hypothetical protein AVDCRST_MAG64-2610 [uncultured Phycisphaerae bacterium]
MPPLSSPRRRALLALAASGALLAVVPAAAHAALIPFGSDLRAEADTVQAHQGDTMFWHTKLANGGQTVVPADGQILSYRLKGTALRHRDDRPPRSDGKPHPGGETMVHFQTMRPQGDGSYRIVATSAAFDVPTTGDPQQVSLFASPPPIRECVKAGDVVVFNTVGGFDAVGDQRNGWRGTPLSPYPMGTPLQVFAAVPGSVTSQFEGADKTNNEDTVRGTEVAGEELLMQPTLGTGPDANQVCGGTQGYVAPPQPKTQPDGTPVAPAAEFRHARIMSKKISLNKKGVTTITLKCSVTNDQVKKKELGQCVGVLRLDAKKGSQTVTVGKAKYTIAGRDNGAVKVKLTDAGKKVFKKAKQKLKVRAVAVTQPGGAEHTNAANFTLKRFGK